MSAFSGTPIVLATEVDGKSAGKTTNLSDDWFSMTCKHLLPTKAGTALHYMTGFDERSCQRYAAGDVKPPAFFLLRLLHSPQGWTWLCAAMSGCEEKWWRDVWLAVECTVAFEAKRKQLEG